MIKVILQLISSPEQDRIWRVFIENVSIGKIEEETLGGQKLFCGVFKAQVLLPYYRRCRKGFVPR
jgi:hypothetical protein